MKLTLAAVLARDRLAPLAALALMTLLAWSYLVFLSHAMAPSGMDGVAGMEGMAMAPMSWSASDAFWMFLMWTVMMAGMMLPSAAPMILVYSGVAQKARRDGYGFAAAGWFAGGYFLAWTGFAAVATAAQFALEQTDLLSADSMRGGRTLAGLLCLAFGLYQFMPLKQACLHQCRAPLAFIQRHGGFRAAPSGALALGLRHGFYCIGCCWAVMALLFAGGVMNLLWVAALAVFVLAEKCLPGGVWIRNLGGVAGLTASGFLLLS